MTVKNVNGSGAEIDLTDRALKIRDFPEILQLIEEGEEEGEDDGD